MKKSKGRGRPSTWTDEQLMELALDVKYTHHGIKLTPSLLEKETKVGRNTWSRRMKAYIDELNTPVLYSSSNDATNDGLLPSIDLIFKKYGKDEIALRNELVKLEVLFYDIYKELQEYKEKKDLHEKSDHKLQLLTKEVQKQKMRADYYEELYNQVVVSSTYPHLRNTKPKTKAPENLLVMKNDLEKNKNLNNLSSHLPTIQEENKKEKTMKRLMDKFDI